MARITDPQIPDIQNQVIISDYNKTPREYNGNEYDYVYGFFKGVMKDEEIASNFTEQIYEIARRSEISPIDIVKTLNGQTGLELSFSLTYYLNSIRSNTSLLGIENVSKPNFYASRTVLI